MSISDFIITFLQVFAFAYAMGLYSIFMIPMGILWAYATDIVAVQKVR